jgi:hypothetical protein
VQNDPRITALLYVIIISLFVFRLVRPQRISVLRLWIMPIFLLGLTAFAVWGAGVAAAQLGIAPPPAWETAAALCLGAVLGVPLGILRGRHSQVEPTDKPGVLYVRSSPLIVLVWLAAFAARAGIRYFMPHASSTATVVGDGLMAFAIAALIASYAIIYQRYRALAPAAAG